MVKSRFVVRSGIVALLLTFIASSALQVGAADATIKVGILQLLSGKMTISEVSVKGGEMMAIDEINAAGGVLGKKLVVTVEDGASDWPTFNEKAKKLLEQDKVAVVFGCWTSASRKAVKDTFESDNGLLFYPVQYEGLEMSPNIFYTGATTNQQIVPAVDYLLKSNLKKMFLLGSDYVFPRTANTIIKAQLAAEGGTLAGEEYVPLGGTEFSTIIEKIKAAKPDVVFSTLNGDSNVVFFKQYKDAGFTAATLLTLSVSIDEDEECVNGAEIVVGQFVAWNYYETTKTPENTKFVAAYKAKEGADRVTAHPVEAGCFVAYLRKLAQEKAK